MTELSHAYQSSLEEALLADQQQNQHSLEKDIFLALLQSPGTAERVGCSVIAGYPMPDSYRAQDIEEHDYYYRLALTAFHAAAMFNQAVNDEKNMGSSKETVPTRGV